MPIAKTAVEIRLHRDNWPPGVDPSTQGAPLALNQAWTAAQEVFTGFLEARQTHATSDQLTPTGARAADIAWAQENLPALRERLTRIRRMSSQAESSLMEKLTADFTEPATDSNDIALMQEIRTWLRTLPDTERLNRIRQLAEQGDKSALRAVLTGPIYLTGVNEEMLVIVRNEAAKKAYPDRHARLEAFRKASEAADRAVEGVIRYVEQETGGSDVPNPMNAVAA